MGDIKDMGYLKRANPRKTQFYQLINDNFEHMLHEVIKEEEMESHENKSSKQLVRKKKLKSSSLESSFEKPHRNNADLVPKKS